MISTDVTYGLGGYLKIVTFSVLWLVVNGVSLEHCIIQRVKTKANGFFDLMSALVSMRRLMHTPMCQRRKVPHMSRLLKA